MIQKTASGRIPSSPVEGVAAEKAAHGFGGSLQDTIAFDGIAGIFGTGWRKTASRSDPRRNRQLVASKESQGHPPAA